MYFLLSYCNYNALEYVHFCLVYKQVSVSQNEEREEKVCKLCVCSVQYLQAEAEARERTEHIQYCTRTFRQSSLNQDAYE